MYDDADYQDVVADVIVELGESIARAIAAGVARERLIVDPGIGFAKRPAHSYGVLARLPELVALDRPVLVGPSRKSFLREALQDRPRAGTGLGDCRRRDGCRPRRRAHRSRPRRRRDGAGRPGGGGNTKGSRLKSQGSVEGIVERSSEV